MLVAQVGDVVLLFRIGACQVVEILDLLLDAGFGVGEGLQELRVGGGFISPQSGLLVYNQL